MLEKMGHAKYGFPVLVVILVSCVMALMFYPMIGMAPRELPFAVLNLDEGASTPQGDMNAGGMIVQTLTGPAAAGGTDPAPIAWRELASQADVDAAIADNELFGALTIPAGFTQQQVAAQAGEGDAPTVTVVLDNAKSPLAATQLHAMLGTMLGQAGLAADVQVVNTGTATAGASPVAGMMSQQLGVLPLVIMSLVGSILLTRIFPARGAAGARDRLRALGAQALYAVGFAFLAGTAATVLLNGLVDAGLPFWQTTIFGWFASLCVMALFLGAFNVAQPLGGLVAFCVVLGGMMTATLPREMLPTFWADWVYPVTPQHMIADGIRDMLYRGADLMPHGTSGLLVVGGVGLALLVVAAVVPRRGVGAQDAPAELAAA